jgi:hypothetical protein
VVIGLIVVNTGGAVGALFFGRKLPWIWFALAVLETVHKVLIVALYRDTDAIRAGVALAGGLAAALLALLLQRRYPQVVFIVGGFLAAGLTFIQALGPLLTPAPEWLVLVLLGAAGIAGVIWATANPALATIVLSALVGAGVLADLMVGPQGIDEAHRFQVYAILALAGIGFQHWRERRKRRRNAPPRAQVGDSLQGGAPA